MKSHLFISRALLIAATSIWLGCGNASNYQSNNVEKSAEIVEGNHTLSAPVSEDIQMDKKDYDRMENPATNREIPPTIDENPKTEEKEKNTDEYDRIIENRFISPKNSPLSTFSIDVDNASYSNVRGYINNGNMPQPDMVRIEEFINYFDYDYPQPQKEHPFEIISEVSQAPWNPQHKLVHIGLQGKELNFNELKPSNLVFLIDASGSMADENKLPLLKKSLQMLLNQLGKNDRVAIVAYAGAAGLVLPSTPASEKETILGALNQLEAGGSTAGGEGIVLAYKVAKENLISNGNNRVILATDGDFNVGVSSTSELTRLLEEKRNEGIFLTICGLGMGNYKDNRMEQMSKVGNGNYFFIDNINEAQKIFVRNLRATLFTIAKDVKIQVEFNPSKVQAYRLIGYENRVLQDEDFNDDKKDAGELGAGHTVTALYEIIPVGVKSEFLGSVDNLKYQKSITSSMSSTNELMTVKFRYKKPKENTSILMEEIINDTNAVFEQSSENFRWAACVAELGLLIRQSEFKGQSSYAQVLDIARKAKGSDDNGDRAEFIKLVQTCQSLAGQR